MYITWTFWDNKNQCIGQEHRHHSQWHTGSVTLHISINIDDQSKSQSWSRSVNGECKLHGSIGSFNWCSLNRDVNKSVCSSWCGVMLDWGFSSEVGSTGPAEHPTTSVAAGWHGDDGGRGNGGRMSLPGSVFAILAGLLLSSVYPSNSDSRSHCR